MRSTEKEILEARKAAIYDDLTKNPLGYSQNLLVGIQAVKSCKRHKQPPLLWFNSNYTYLSDDKKDIKEWIRGKNKDFTDRDLITDRECVAGFEADFVIFVGSREVSAYMSRCRGQFVHIIE